MMGTYPESILEQNTFAPWMEEDGQNESPSNISFDSVLHLQRHFAQTRPHSFPVEGNLHSHPSLHRMLHVPYTFQTRSSTLANWEFVFQLSCRLLSIPFERASLSIVLERYMDSGDANMCLGILCTMYLVH